MKKGTPYFLKNLSLLSYIALVMIVPILAGVWIGNWLDKTFEFGNVFLIVFTILGIGSGFMNVYKLMMKYMKK